MQNRIYLSPPHIGTIEQEFVKEVFDSNWIAPLGPQVDAFEHEIAERVGVRGAVALSSGTAAIHLALRLLGVGSGDTVLCSSLTFVSSVNPIRYQGAEPILVDSDPCNWNMSVSALKEALAFLDKEKKLPKAAIVVNLYGQSADYDPIIEVCEEYGVPIIEDAAESLGATYKGKMSGALGRFGIFSFNGNKIITTSGGGMLVGNDLVALERARFWATQARDPAPHYQHSQVGYNYRLSNVLAAIGRGQLSVLSERVAARRAVFQRYTEGLGDIDGLEFMPEASYGKSTCWLTALTLDSMKIGVAVSDVIAALALENIESRPLWKPMHRQPLYSDCRYFSHGQHDSVSDRLFRLGVCLPSGSALSIEDQARVISIVRSCIHTGTMVSSLEE